MCEHLTAAGSPPRVEVTGCLDCLAENRTDWVHLRQCLTCDHVSCCDSSPPQHATAHYAATGHPVMRSAQPGEAWRWCYVHEVIG